MKCFRTILSHEQRRLVHHMCVCRVPCARACICANKLPFRFQYVMSGHESGIWPEILADCRFAYISNVLRFVWRSRNLSRFTVAICSECVWAGIVRIYNAIRNECTRHGYWPHYRRNIQFVINRIIYVSLRSNSIFFVWKKLHCNFSCFPGLCHHIYWDFSIPNIPFT